MTQVAQLETHFLDRVFGHKLFSEQALGASFGCSMGMVSTLLLWRELSSPGLFNVLPVLTVMLICSLVVGIASVFIRNHPVLRRVVVLAAFVLLTVWVGPIAGSRDVIKDVALTISVLATPSFACNVIFIVFTRRLIRWAGQMTSWQRVFASVISNIAIALLILSPVIAWQWVWQAIRVNSGGLGDAMTVLFYVAVSNIFDAVLACLFVLLAVILLVHRAVWPLLARTLFKLADIGTRGRRAILTTVGIALLGTSVFGGKFPELIVKLIEKFGG